MKFSQHLNSNQCAPSQRSELSPLKPASKYASKIAISFIPLSGARSNSEGHLNSTKGEIEYFLRISINSSPRITEQGPSSSSGKWECRLLNGAIGIASSASRISPPRKHRRGEGISEKTLGSHASANERSWKNRKVGGTIHSSTEEIDS